MLGKIFGIFTLISLIFGVFGGTLGEVANAIPDGAERALEVTLSLLGLSALWGGVAEVLREAGAIRVLARLLSPLLRLVFPHARAHGEDCEEIAAALGANLLGMGNAATPLSLRAMEMLHRHNPHPERASDEEITFAVLSTSPLTLIPTTVLALLRGAGAADPFAVMLPVWISSVATFLFALLLCLLLRTLHGRRDAP